MANTYINRNFPSSGNRTTWTLSMWVKRSLTGSEQMLAHAYNGANDYTKIRFEGDDILTFENYTGGTRDIAKRTNRKFKDTNGFYHLLFVNTPSAQTIYVNGVQETSWRTNTTGNVSTWWNHNISNTMFASVNGGSLYFSGVASHVHFCDGTALAPTVFGETDATTGEWKIKTSPTFTLGTNGFTILKDGNTITDQSSNSNAFTLGGGTLTKTEDSPSNVFATNNPLWKQESSRYFTHSYGNTMVTSGGSNTWYQTPATLAFSSGKFYWECKFNYNTANIDKNTAGVIDYDKTQESGQFQDKVGSVFFKNEDGGETRLDGTTSSADYGEIAHNQILGIAVDMDASTPTVKFYRNGSLLATVNASSLAGKFVTPAQSSYASGRYQVNYGNGYFGSTQISSAGTNASNNGIFEYDVPTGYTALSTKGLNL
jgi:hypothetical protein